MFTVLKSKDNFGYLISQYYVIHVQRLKSTGQKLTRERCNMTVLSSGYEWHNETQFSNITTMI